MSVSGRFITVEQAADGPIWQWLEVGDRVKPRRGRKLGTVVRVIEPRGVGGVSMQVAVAWDNCPSQPDRNPSDYLVLVERPA